MFRGLSFRLQRTYLASLQEYTEFLCEQVSLQAVEASRNHDASVDEDRHSAISYDSGRISREEYHA